MRSLAVTNIGRIATGILDAPLTVAADTIVCRDKKITAIANASDLDLAEIDTLVDAKGMVVMPGLVDGHCHVHFGDYNPRLKLFDWIFWARNSGVTSMVSAGEFNLPGMPDDVDGIKHHAILQKKAYDNYRPAGVKVHGGAFLLQPGMTEADFAGLAAHGVWIVGEVGLGRVQDAHEAASMIRWAEKYGMKSSMHFGGPGKPGSALTKLADVLIVKPTIVSHINGGSTAPPLDDVEKLVRESDLNLEFVLLGDPRPSGR